MRVETPVASVQDVMPIHLDPREEIMAKGSVYKVIELVGSSAKSWEDAAAKAIETASKSLKDLRIAEVSELDMQIDGGKVISYRARIKVSFKYKK